jgi:L-ascorbate metabolism protein UlaG (beta-lactamase superfamily)
MSFAGGTTALLLAACILCASGLRLSPTATAVKYLETNSWVYNLADLQILVDPVLSAPLDFGIPTFYEGKKRYIDGPGELANVMDTVDFAIITQGLDDHAHTPTLKVLAKERADLQYVCPPSAVPIMENCGIARSKLTVLSPGQKTFLSNKDTKVEVIATTGASVGPPWAAPENGYIVRAAKDSKKQVPSIYYEPHCMYDVAELSRYTVDYVITPIVSQELPFFTLVDGGMKAIKLAETLKAKNVIPMANGNLVQRGVLTKLITSNGSEDEFKALVKASKADQKFTFVPAPAGSDIPIRASVDA